MKVNSLNNGDYGTAIYVNIEDCGNTDLSTLNITNVMLYLRTPDKEIKERSAVLYDASKGIVSYITQEGDIDAEGVWGLQVKLTSPLGEWHTDLVTFEVNPSLSI